MMCCILKQLGNGRCQCNSTNIVMAEFPLCVTKKYIALQWMKMGAFAHYHCRNCDILLSAHCQCVLMLVQWAVNGLCHCRHWHIGVWQWLLTFSKMTIDIIISIDNGKNNLQMLMDVSRQIGREGIIVLVRTITFLVVKASIATYAYKKLLPKALLNRHNLVF